MDYPSLAATLPPAGDSNLTHDQRRLLHGLEMHCRPKQLSEIVDNTRKSVAESATMDQLAAMRTFVRVAEAGSFAAVAARLDVARSVVTRQVAALEERLGTKLIARSTRRLALTAAGEAYLEKCREILALVEEAEGDLSEARRELRGRIRLSVPLSLGLRYLSAMICDFTSTHPQVSLELDFSDRRIDLIAEGMDLALRVTAQLEDTVVARRIGTCRSAVIASPDYLARHGRPRHPRDLSEHQCFGYVPALRSNWPFFIKKKLTWVPTEGRIQANNGDALLDAAIRGLGITYQPTFIAAEALRAGQVVSILEDYPPIEMGLYAIFPGGRYLPHRVRALVDFLAARIGDRPAWDDLAAGPPT